MVIVLAVSACGAGGSSGAEFASPDAIRLKVNDLVGSSCGEAAPDVTSGSAMNCKWDGKQVTLITYPSEKAAQNGAEYLTGMGFWSVHQESRWLVAVMGDQPDLDQLVKKLKA